MINNSQIQIYGPEKVLADCFKFRNNLGLGAPINALKRYFELPNKERHLNALKEFAKLN
ncbi:hypothetical protein KQH62_00020 [bacterium]|nr:hypothetical protein [bacterium]